MNNQGKLKVGDENWIFPLDFMAYFNKEKWYIPKEYEEYIAKAVQSETK